jgi:chemotaxis signal transduction protein
MRPTRPNRRKAHTPGQPVILFIIGEVTFAIIASAVTEIQTLKDTRPIRSMGKVRHSLMREGRRYWVVDSNLHFGLLPTHADRILLLREAPIAVKVDAIERMAEISRVLPLPRAFQNDERHWYLGLAIIDGKVIPVVNPNSFLSHFDLNALEATITVPESPLKEVHA